MPFPVMPSGGGDSPPKPGAEKPPPPAQNTAWAIKIATVSGIPIRLHFTFLLFLVWIGLAGRGGTGGLGLVYVLAVFTCVVLHELGHSLVALCYHIPVADITLYPIGGVARIEKRPTARQELVIAVAGPLVNVAIALLLWAGLGFESTATVIAHLTAARAGGAVPLIERVMLANVTLVLFNLIPAFPMDGGRVLRAALALSLPPARATAIAAGVGQVIAIVAGLWAVLSGAWALLFIAFFVYVGAGQEASVYRQESLLEGVRVRQAMISDVRTLSVGSTLKEAADVLLDTSQHDFPVVHGDEVQGVLTRDGLLRGLASFGPGAYVAGAMSREYASAGPDEDLTDVLPRLQGQPGPLVVLEPDTSHLLGIVTGENVQEFFTVRRIVEARDSADKADPRR